MSLPDPTIRLGRVLLGSRANGPGLRDVFWVTGCSIGCPGCINPQFLDPRAGERVDAGAIQSLISRRRDQVEGITFSGGEPTEQAEAVGLIARHARQLGLSVVLFTGKTLEACRRRADCAALLDFCDLVVAGPYVAPLWQPGSPLLGSLNQTLHFLTERYRPGDLQTIPNLEIRLGRSQVAVTGYRLRS